MQPHGALTAGWQVGPEVNGKPMAPAQVGIVGQRGTQARLPTAAGILATLLEVGHGAQVRRAGREQLPGEHTAGLHGIGGWTQEGQGQGAGIWLAWCPGPASSYPIPITVQGAVGVRRWVQVCVYRRDASRYQSTRLTGNVWLWFARSRCDYMAGHGHGCK